MSRYVPDLLEKFESRAAANSGLRTSEHWLCSALGIYRTYLLYEQRMRGFNFSLYCQQMAISESVAVIKCAPCEINQGPSALSVVREGHCGCTRCSHYLDASLGQDPKAPKIMQERAQCDPPRVCLKCQLQLALQNLYSSSIPSGSSTPLIGYAHAGN